MSVITVQVVEDGLLVVDSRLIAEELGIDHENFLGTVYKYQTQIEQAFGILRFETGKIDGRGRPSKYALLTENQATLVMTLSRNTEKVVKCKIGLVQAFDRAKQAIESDLARLDGGDRHLSDSEASRLARLEHEVHAGLALMEKGRARVWLAIAQIHEEELYLEAGFTSYAKYCKSRWGWEESYAFEVAKAGKVVAKLSDAGFSANYLPSSVAQFRPLASLSDEALPEAWGKVIEEVKSPEKLTAKRIKEVIQPPALPAELDTGIPVSSENSKCQISVWLDPGIKRLLEEQAELEGRSLSNMASYCLEEGLYKVIERRGGGDRP